MLRQKATLIARIVYFVDLALTTLAFFSAFFLRNLILPHVAPERFPTGLYPLQEYLKHYGKRDDEYTRVSGRWLISRRDTTWVFGSMAS